MNGYFKGNCLATLIGSLPLVDHEEATRLVFKHTPDIPNWVQLPAYKEEGMVSQFLPGMPGLVAKNDKVFIDTDGETFGEDILKFYEDYMDVTDGESGLSGSRFALQPDIARGFFTLTDCLDAASNLPAAVKGQVTGPFTFCTGLSDQNGRAVFYDEQLRDAGVKLLAQKAGWQVRQLNRFKKPVIIFVDEPALAGFGSSAFISISPDEIKDCLEEVFAAVHAEGGLAGVHVCANTDWSLILDSSADIVNFDAYAYFDRFVLYPDQIKQFIESGRILAWGIVPTLNKEDIEKETTDSLVAAWNDRVDQIEALGIDRKKIWAQSLITPSCGAGSLSIDLAGKVLGMTKAVSVRLRNQL